jgi:hypothetical protein
MRFATLTAAVLALIGGLVVLRWMPGKPKPAATDTSLEDVELALMAEDAVVKSANQEG